MKHTCAFLLFLLPVFSFLCADSWNMTRKSPEAQASFSTDPENIYREWHYQWKNRRKYEQGLAVWASPAIGKVGGKVMAFIGGYDQTIHAMDLGSKQIAWRYLTNSEIQNAPAVTDVEGRSTIFFTSSDRSVYAASALTGRLFWTKELAEPAPTQGRAFLGAPAFDNGRLYISSFIFDRSLPGNRQTGELRALDASTGEEIWKEKISGGQLSSPIVWKWKKRRFISIAEKRGRVTTFEVTTGMPHLLWTFQMPHEVMGSPAILTDNEYPLLYLGSKYGNLIAVDALTGVEKWQRMAGNWIDNTVAVGRTSQGFSVFAGSHDYHVYSFNAITGELRWKTSLGGEVYSTPVFFSALNRRWILAAALDNHLYLIDAENGKIKRVFFTGNPIWDKLSKGETLWGSPAVVEAGKNSVAVHGSFNDKVLVIPLFRESQLEATARNPADLWWSLLVTALIFLGTMFLFDRFIES